MAVVLGNLGLSIDVVSSRTILPERKSRPAIMEGVLSLNSAARRSEGQGVSAFSSGKGLDSDGENRSLRLVVVRGKAKSKMNGVDPDAGWSDEENGSEEMLRRLKEVEERKELEKKAEELQSRMDDAGDGLRRDETDDQKRLRVRKELEKVAKEQAEQRKTAQMMFDLGQKAYGKGMYGRAIEFLEGALTIIPRATLLGGEIQIWLAMAYEANDRHGECIALYKQMEKTHPVVNIRRQAANLRYILEAPKLKISQEEMVTIPLIGSAYDSYAGTWTDKDKDKDKDGRTRKQITSSKDYLGDFLVWRPPTHLEKSQGFWVALGLWLGLVGAALFLQT